MNESEIIKMAECWFRGATEEIEACDKSDKSKLGDSYRCRAFAGMYLVSFGNGDCDSTIEDYKKAIELNPLYWLNYLECSVVYKLKGDIVNAEKYKKKAMELGGLKKNEHRNRRAKDE